MVYKKLYLENDILFCEDNCGRRKKINNSYKAHKVIDDIITNGYKITFSGNNMILKSKKCELELVDSINLLDNKYLSFLNYDIRKNMDTCTGSKSNLRKKNRGVIYSDGENLLYLDCNGYINKLDCARRIHRVLDGIITDGYKVVFDDSNMILINRDKQLVLEDYINLLDNKDLSFLDYDICKRLASNWFLNKNKKNVIKLISRNAACFSLVFSVLFSILPFNALAYKNKYPRNSNNQIEDVDGLLDDSLTFGKDELYSSAFDDFYANPSLLTDNLNESIKIIGEDIRDDLEVVEEPLYSDEDIEKVYSFMEFNHLNLESFKSLIELMISEDCPFGVLYETKDDAIRAIINDELTYQLKFLTIMIREGNTYEEIDKMCAGVCGESYGSGTCYDDAYAVASTLVNRTHKDSYVEKYGYNLYSQFCAPGQYEVEISGNYKQFLGQIDLEGYHAAIDAFYTREAMHNYLEFRASWYEMDYKYETFVTGGNKFIIKMKDSAYVPYPDEEIVLDDVKTLVLEKTN